MLFSPFSELFSRISSSLIVLSLTLPLLKSLAHDPIYLNTITCCGALVSQATKHPDFADLALTQEFNIINFLFNVLKNTSEAMMPCNQYKNFKQNKVSDCTVFTETAQVLSHFPIHYTEYIM